MDKVYKVICITGDGTMYMVPTYYKNSYGAFENAVSFNMQLHGIENILDPHLRLQYRKGVFAPDEMDHRDSAYLMCDGLSYCISEVFESEQPSFMLAFEAINSVN